MKCTAQLFRSLFNYSKTHKIISTIGVVVIATGGYYSYHALFGTSSETRYVLSRSTIGELTTTIVGTGQVSASNQIDLKAKASGNITRINAQVGQEMKAGQLIAQIDNRDVSISLESARLSLQKLTQPADANTLTQAQNSLQDAQQSKVKAEVALAKAYEDGLTAVSSSFVDLPSIILGTNDIFYAKDGFLNDTSVSTLSSTAQTYRNSAGTLFDVAQNDYKDLQSEYRLTARSNSTNTTETLLLKTYSLTSKLSESLKNSSLAVEFIRNSANSQISSQATTALNNINSWISKNNSNLSNLLSAKTAIENAKNDISAADRNIKERNESLAQTIKGADPLDIRSQQLNIAQKELDYDKYNIRAPFDGILAKLNVKIGDNVSDSVGVFITKQKVAEITLNEVDVANIKVGQPVLLTFDAVDDVTATGTVANIDLVGTVSQGVVSYTTQIAFDTTDERIKPGMSVSATIITKNKPNVLLIPTAAVKSKNGTKYVEVANMTAVQTSIKKNTFSSTTGSTSMSEFKRRGSSTGANLATSPLTGPIGPNSQSGTALPTPPIEKIVTVGESNDTSIEILSGLSEGEFVVTRTIMNATTTKATTNSLFSVPRTGGAGGVSGAARGR
ncbi:MAG: HlyD family efflux transporter periplasmic adaptor subunit [Candidatus Pacebacteria bacterium]|nr:HlyD family efflux transporter periplasmic adaptor subunit [Candidatus Paceibacterota bacterium]